MVLKVAERLPPIEIPWLMQLADESESKNSEKSNAVKKEPGNTAKTENKAEIVDVTKFYVHKKDQRNRKRQPEAEKERHNNVKRFKGGVTDSMLTLGPSREEDTTKSLGETRNETKEAEDENLEDKRRETESNESGNEAENESKGPQGKKSSFVSPRVKKLKTNQKKKKKKRRKGKV